MSGDDGTIPRMDDDLRRAGGEKSADPPPPPKFDHGTADDGLPDSPPAVPEKAAAFDLLAVALTNRWADGSWTWWCCAPCGSMVKRQTQAEAVADLVEWAEWIARRKGKVSA